MSTNTKYIGHASHVLHEAGMAERGTHDGEEESGSEVTQDLPNTHLRCSVTTASVTTVVSGNFSMNQHVLDLSACEISLQTC